MYAVNCATLYDDAELQQVLPQLTADRAARVQQLRTPEKRAQRAAAGLLLRHLFGDATITSTENGKPYLLDCPQIHFNLSHTGAWVLCAVSDAPVGVDAQALTHYRAKVAARWFSEEERQWIAQQSDERFTRLWTRKEAYAKMTGDGMVSAMRSAPQLPHVTKEYDDLADDGLYIAVCTGKANTFAPAIEIIKEPLW